MVNACPPQSDPRPNVADFISNKDTKALAGLTVEGLETLVQVVADEIRRQEPESNVVIADREFLSDEDITFGKDLEAYINRKLSDGKRLHLILCGDIPVIGWNTVLEKFRGKNIKAYYTVLACRQVPLCSKIDL
jgi:hypothetical protein